MSDRADPMDRKTVRITITLIGAVIVAIMSMPKTHPEQPRTHACDTQADWDQKVASARDKGVSPASAVNAIIESDEPLHSILLNHIAAIYQTRPSARSSPQQIFRCLHDNARQTCPLVEGGGDESRLQESSVQVIAASSVSNQNLDRRRGIELGRLEVVSVPIGHMQRLRSATGRAWSTCSSNSCRCFADHRQASCNHARGQWQLPNDTRRIFATLPRSRLWAGIS